MKYKAIIFDFGNTLAYTEPHRLLEMPVENRDLIKRLHKRGHLLGIISNANQYSDSAWVRNRLASYNLLDLFEATKFVYEGGLIPPKPSPMPFETMLAFMGVHPNEALMVGDSEHCDGAASAIGMTYFKVDLSTGAWADTLLIYLA